MIKDFQPRLYQETIFAKASSQNSLIVLPTGLGKTNIFLMLAAYRMQLYPNSKILLLGPTRPLIDQYYNVFKKHFVIDASSMAVFTGMVAPAKRLEQWKTAKIIFSTPQGLENDVISGRITLDDVSLLGFDEAHRAVGDYSYVFVAKRYHEDAKHERIVGMTASPGSDLEKINEVISHLFIEHLEVRVDDDPDVRQYIQDVKMRWEKVDFPEELKKVHSFLNACFKSKLEKIKEYGVVQGFDAISPSKREVLALQAQLQGELASGNKDFSVLKSLSVAAEALKIQHAIELIETQGVHAVSIYLEDLNAQGLTSKTKAVVNLVSDPNFRSALFLVRKLKEQGIEHPKFEKLRELIKSSVIHPHYKVIVFTQYRDTGVKVTEELNRLEGIKAELFVGQAKKKNSGLSQKKQIDMLDRFKADEFNVLVSSSVGEEGLDVPQVDLVVFYEPIPSAIRYIQRKGRTGRQESGEVVILSTTGTRDEAYQWSAKHREKRMYSILGKLKGQLTLRAIEKPEPSQKNEKYLVYADYREKGNRVIKELLDLGADLKLEKLEHGDYLLSSRCAVEFKTVEDFVDSLIDGRLIQQVKDLKMHYEKPLIIIEGTNDIYSARNVHPNAIRGLIATITVSFGVPITATKTQKDTAEMLYAIARREQETSDRAFSPHTEKPVQSIKEMQEYIVSSFPGVGQGLAKTLLKKFGSIKAIVDASEEELQSAEKIGAKKAKQIRDIIEKTYSESL